MYSQNDEEKYILERFVDLNNGKFVEIGGYDPFKFSNTRALYEKGWNGVYVEPSPACMKRLKAEYAEDPRIALVEAAITDQDGVITLHECGGDAISTTDAFHKNKWERGAGVIYTPIEVKSISVKTFLEDHGAETDFLNLDVEGTNLTIFNLLPDAFIKRLKCICVEHDGHHEAMSRKLMKYGFFMMLINGENLIMAK